MRDAIGALLQEGDFVAVTPTIASYIRGVWIGTYEGHTTAGKVKVRVLHRGPDDSDIYKNHSFVDRKAYTPDGEPMSTRVIKVTQESWESWIAFGRRPYQ